MKKTMIEILKDLVETKINQACDKEQKSILNNVILELESLPISCSILREALGQAIHVAVNYGRNHPAKDDLLANAVKVYHETQ